MGGGGNFGTGVQASFFKPFRKRENQTLNIGSKLFLSDKIYVSHLFKLHFGLSSDLDCFQDELGERERKRNKN